MSDARRPFVCMVAYTEYPSDARVRREAETLVAHGFQVRCLCLATDDMPGPAPTLLDGVEVQPLRVRKYRGKSTLAYVGSYLRFLAASTAACTALLARGQLDVLHAHNIPDFLVLAGLLPRMAGRKVVLDVHDSVPETFATKFSGSSNAWRLLCLEERMSAWVAHRVICVNHPQRDTLVARGIPASKTFISMNVPDPSIFSRPLTPGRQQDGPDHVNLVYHGTMAERLGVDLVIRAVATLKERLPSLRLHLWGHGDDLPRFQDLAKELRVSDRVEFRPKGFPLKELPEHLHRMHIGVVGNRRTIAGDLMLPVKLLEYVSLGIPVVAPRLRTIERYFSDDMLAYYPPEDVGALAESIHQLSSQPQRRAAQAERARSFLAEYGWQRQGGELAGFYRTLVEN